MAKIEERRQLRSKAKESLGGLEESHACVSIPTDLEMRFSLRRFDVGRLPPNRRRPPSRSAMTAQWARRDKAALSSGCKSTRNLHRREPRHRGATGHVEKRRCARWRSLLRGGRLRPGDSKRDRGYRPSMSNR